MNDPRGLRQSWCYVWHREFITSCVALIVLVIIAILPFICVLHCHMRDQDQISGVIDVSSSYVCHLSLESHKPPPLNPTLIQELNQWVLHYSQREILFLSLVSILWISVWKLHNQINIAPPIPPPRAYFS